MVIALYKLAMYMLYIHIICIAHHDVIIMVNVFCSHFVLSLLSCVSLPLLSPHLCFPICDLQVSCLNSLMLILQRRYVLLARSSILYYDLSRRINQW